MNEAIKKLSEEVKQAMVVVFASAATKSLIEATKAAADSGSFEVIISTADIDRQGETVKQDGWNLKNYLSNPVVLWGHDYYSLPIGITESIEVVDGKLLAKGKFAPEEANPFAQQVRRLYDLKIVRATSVGFIASEMEGSIITKAELLEFSFVPVPANPYALSLAQAKELKLDLAMIATKGLKLEVKEKVVGDECTMDNGEIGTMQDDGNGGMVCKPKAAKAEGDACTMDDGSEGMMEMHDGGMVCVAKAAKYFCGVCARYYAKGSVCLGEFIKNAGDPPNHFEDCKADTNLAKKWLEAKDKHWLHGKKDAVQIGAILAQLQNVIDNALVQAAKLIFDIIQTEYAQSVAGKAEIAATLKASTSLHAIKTEIDDLEQKLAAVEGEVRPDGGAPQERSQDKGFMESMRTVDDFLAARNILKSFVKAASGALENLNERERKARKGRRQ